MSKNMGPTDLHGTPSDLRKKIRIGKYRHYKGKLYEVIGVAKDSKTLEDMVVYKALYESGKFGKDSLWVRPLKMFTHKVIVEQKEVDRFQDLNE